MEETADNETAIPPIPTPPGVWRLGFEYPKATALLMRFATRSDRKMKGAERLSKFYCKYGNPNYGLVGYDNILWAWLTIFQHITLSSWSDVMYMVMDAVNYWVWIFYVGLIIIGAFFMVRHAARSG